jgi:hypothetical protein
MESITVNKNIIVLHLEIFLFIFLLWHSYLLSCLLIMMTLLHPYEPKPGLIRQFHTRVQEGRTVGGLISRIASVTPPCLRHWFRIRGENYYPMTKNEIILSLRNFIF